MNANIEIPSSLLTEAMKQSLFTGELGNKVAVELAHLYAEITTYNRTDAAKLLNISRNTLYQYESQNLVKFREDGRISVADLLQFQRKLKDDPEEDNEPEITRKSKISKRRSVKR